MRGSALLLIFILTGIAHAQDAKETPVLVLDGDGHTGTVHRLLFTPDSKQFITVSDNKTIWPVRRFVRFGSLNLRPGTETGLAAASSPVHR